jgi:hypothetical protein
MDASTQRRGMPTVHAKHSAQHHSRAWQGESRRFGESVAILAGDLALVYSEQIRDDLLDAFGDLLPLVRRSVLRLPELTAVAGGDTTRRSHRNALDEVRERLRLNAA